jgi:hypothetical protein
MGKDQLQGRGKLNPIKPSPLGRGGTARRWVRGLFANEGFIALGTCGSQDFDRALASEKANAGRSDRTTTARDNAVLRRKHAHGEDPRRSLCPRVGGSRVSETCLHPASHNYPGQPRAGRRCHVWAKVLERAQSARRTHEEKPTSGGIAVWRGTRSNCHTELFPVKDRHWFFSSERC